jgi:putative transposase
MTLMDQLEHGGITRIFRARRKINAPGVISHITQRASGADLLFHEEDDYLEMLTRMKQVSRTQKLEFIAFVLMPNHLHLLLRQSEANLYEAMQELFSRYAQRHNRKYERKGHLFGGPYRQAVCLDEAYALTVSLYIHLNPVRAGLVHQPTDYRWSSCRLFTESEVGESFVAPQRILEILSNDSLRAQDIYCEMLEEGRKIRMGEVIEDQRAIHDLQWGLSKVIPLIIKLKSPKKGAPRQHWDEAEIQERIAAITEGRDFTMPREREAKRYLAKQLISRGFTRKEIAERAGLSRKTIYNLLKQQSK